MISMVQMQTQISSNDLKANSPKSAQNAPVAGKRKCDRNTFQDIISDGQANLIEKKPAPTDEKPEPIEEKPALNNDESAKAAENSQDSQEIVKPEEEISESELYSAVIPDTVTKTAAEQSPNVGNEATGQDPVVAEENIVPVLESNMPDTDIKQPLKTEYNLPSRIKSLELNSRLNNLFGDEKVMARMPQSTPGPLDPSLIQEKVQAASEIPLEAPRPLENVNDNQKPGAKEQGNLIPFNETKEGQELNSLSRVLPVQQTIDISPERVLFAEQLQGAQKPAPVSADNLFEALVERINLAKSNGETQLQIQLKPEHLGKVSIVLSQANGELTAKIQAEDLGVKNMLNSQINMLVDNLADKGIKISGLEVVYTGIPGENFDRSNSRQQSEEGSAKARPDQISIDEAEAGLSEDPAWGISQSVADDELSSVEYRA